MHKPTSQPSGNPISLGNSRVFQPLILTSLIFFALIVTNFFIRDSSTLLSTINFLLSFSGLMSLLWIILLVKDELYIPFIHIRNWSQRLKEKDYHARLPSINNTEFSKLAADLNNLSEVIQFLAEEFQDKVEKQTSKIKDQDDSLKILYEIATSINESNNIDELNNRFLQILIKLTSAHAGTVRLLTENKQLKMVASIGLTKNFIRQECLVPLDRCLCGKSFYTGKTMQDDSINQCNQLNHMELFQDEKLGIISVPIYYQDDFLGVFNLFINKKHINIQNKDHEDLLVSIGKHLGVAYEKFRLTRKTREHSVIKERTLLAHELHDSLAQTLTGIKFQLKILEENLEDEIPVNHDDIKKLQDNLDQAYTEVRALISHFRAPMDDKGLIPAIQKIIDQFSRDSKIKVFFQNNWVAQKIKSENQLQLIRIMQEALNNIKKHSQASTVRVMLKSHTGYNELLIEDDGIGINQKNLQSSLGEHIGLSVMQERAQRMGGKLNIESETGEGTQILLSFPSYNSAEKPVQFVP